MSWFKNSVSPGTDLINNVYSDTAEFGKYWAIIKAVGSFFAIICFLYLGSLLMKDNMSASTIGTAIASDTPDCYTDNGIKRCRTNISYAVDGIQYMSSLNSTYSGGDKVKIYYNPKDPTKITAYSYYKIGVFLIILSLFLMLIAGLQFYAIYTTKFGSAASGIGGAMDIID